MAESEISKLYENLSLADEDGAICERPEADQREGEVEVEVDLCLIGKILSGKKVNREAFIHLIEQLWSPFGRVKIESVEFNIFMFKFINQEERNRIWQRGPWYFEKSLIVLEKPEGRGSISQLKFNKVELWIQIHDVPIICMNKRTAKWMAEQIGRVIEIPFESKDCWGKFLKVKVQIDITKPLKRWLHLKLDKSNDIVMVSLKYERLPEFCYVCGRIGHANKECSDVEAKIKALKGVSTKFGSWMRASVLNRQKMRFDQNGVGKSMFQSQLKERREGKEVGLQIVGSGSDRRGEDEGELPNGRSGSFNSQEANQTASVRVSKEVTDSKQKNILAKLSGSGSSLGHGLKKVGPSEEDNFSHKQSKDRGMEAGGPG
ncbi:hypothetical protein EZV62_000005 [Acer yangbiense]|uniref:CCHC-type domain-containing protein n=1 Tax=Acer yangbiense TaxID=1000413 RepID=A0A5C7ISG5_9ROSI|nr:hypothetical protein EZV62_000005 [Acer yangbiense]